ncbi:DUF7261 family protein [Haladaptatus sp. CMSO5]|uniref:DUF7261 family protein n=1 Tax=Haladaptatus sp. CMSO5 TaxID=3120514 RepID=UPI002FCE31D8
MRRRGQMVLAAAALLAVALVPVVFAYLQLGYHPDVAASNDYDAPTENAEHVLSRAVATASEDIPQRYDWDSREAAVETIHGRLSPTIDTLETSRIEKGTAYEISTNQTVAASWAATNCPGGPNRQFGSCEATRGVVVQERAGETHLVAVAFDVTVTTARGVTDVTIVV